MNSQVDNNIEEIICSCSKGNTDSYQELYYHLQKPLFGFIVSRTNNREDAKDILQDVFMDLWRALAKFSYRNDKQFYGFVYTITKRKLAKYYDKNIETVEFDEEYITDNYEQLNGDTIFLVKLLKKLKPKYREVIELRHWSDLKFGEIANFLNTKETTVKVRYHRALQQLQILMQEYEK